MFGAPGHATCGSGHLPPASGAPKPWIAARTLEPPALPLISVTRSQIPGPSMLIYREFHFEAAHYLPSARAGHPNARIHGHSFRVRISVEGEPDPETGLVMHFDDLAAAIADAREALDHRLLNEVEGLRAPTLELVALWLWNRLSNRVPGLAEIHVARDTCHEGVVYRGPQNPSRMAAE